MGKSGTEVMIRGFEQPPAFYLCQLWLRTPEPSEKQTEPVAVLAQRNLRRVNDEFLTRKTLYRDY